MNYRQQILSIRSDYLRGHITFDRAKALILPLLADMNKRGAIIARRHGQKFVTIRFSTVFR